jgi:hypothetical protein
MGLWCGWHIDVEGIIEHPRKTRKAVQDAFYGETIRGYGEAPGFDDLRGSGPSGTIIMFDERMPTGAESKEQARKIAQAIVGAEGKTHEELPMQVEIHFYDTNYDECYSFPEGTKEEAIRRRYIERKVAEWMNDGPEEVVRVLALWARRPPGDTPCLDLGTAEELLADLAEMGG